jgi:TRAP-type C4-dicarboxylate transport system permease small subunit
MHKILSILAVFGVGLFCGVFWGGIAWFMSCSLTQSPFEEPSSLYIIIPVVIGGVLFILSSAGAHEKWFTKK